MSPLIDWSGMPIPNVEDISITLKAIGKIEQSHSFRLNDDFLENHKVQKLLNELGSFNTFKKKDSKLQELNICFNEVISLRDMYLITARLKETIPDFFI